MSIRISVCTPTFNRAYILHQLYESLRKQSFCDFEWVIVDDGSVDETEDLVACWQKVATFPIRYFKQRNGGKHRAVNQGLDMAKGEVFFVVDSDDYLTPDALEKIDRWFCEISGVENIAGVVANKGYSPNDSPNPRFQGHHLDKSFLDMNTYQENGELVLSGERAIALYTDVFRKYRYPEFEGEKFVTEAVSYNRIANAGYLVRFYNDIIWVFQYHEDGLTRSGDGLYLNNPQGYGLWLREKAKFMGDSYRKIVRMWYSFYCDLLRCDKEHYVTLKQCADYIGAPVLAIYAAAIVHKLKHMRIGEK